MCQREIQIKLRRSIQPAAVLCTSYTDSQPFSDPGSYSSLLTYNSLVTRLYINKDGLLKYHSSVLECY
jgi:hypothetical protein